MSHLNWNEYTELFPSDKVKQSTKRDAGGHRKRVKFPISSLDRKCASCSNPLSFSESEICGSCRLNTYSINSLLYNVFQRLFICG